MKRAYTGPPATLGDIRRHGVTHLSVWCECGRKVNVDMSEYDGSAAVPSFNGKFRCSVCGSKKTEVQPAWGHRASR